MRERLSTAVEWAAEARGHQHNSTKDAYNTAMDLLDRCQITYMKVDSKHDFLVHHLTAKEASSLSSDAASFAIEEGRLKEAVEILERGRTFVWATMRGYRPELGKLRSHYPKLADKFESLNTKLERFAALSELPSSHPTSLAHLDNRAVRDGNVLRDDWDATLKDIRKKVGFRDFLILQTFDGKDGLRQAVTEGPVVIFNLSNYKADALILPRIRRIPVPSSKPNEVASTSTIPVSPGEPADIASTPIIPVSLGKPEDIVQLTQDYVKLGWRRYLPNSLRACGNNIQHTHSNLSLNLERCSGLIMNY